MRPFALGLVSLWFLACGGNVQDAPTTGDGGAVDTGAASDSALGAKSYRTHVILGDSISDRGGEAPYYYDLLDKNDDARWPTDKGRDFATRYPGIQVQKKSKGGSTAANLGGQIDTLPMRLDGPVLVTITIGGNDVQAALAKILTSGDDSLNRADFAEFLEESLGKLFTKDRFGPGVEVTVLMTNIYDPSDGTGKFTFASGTKCGGALGIWPASRPTAELLVPWQKVMTDVAAKHPGTVVLDLHGKFAGHGVPGAETWFVKDCIHPNAAGHDAIRDLFWDAIQKL